MRLRWPYAAVAAWFGIFAFASPFMALGTYLQNSADIKALAWVLVVFVLILEFTWIVKALYRAATGVFRAEAGPSARGA